MWAKAVSDAHGTILEQLGVTHVVYPEKEMGKRVAHLVRGAMQDYIEIGDDFALVTAAANQTVSGVPLGEARIRSKYGVTITAVKKPGAHWSYTTADTVIDAGDLMLIAGQTQKAEAFSQLR